MTLHGQHRIGTQVIEPRRLVTPSRPAAVHKKTRRMIMACIGITQFRFLRNGIARETSVEVFSL